MLINNENDRYLMYKNTPVALVEVSGTNILHYKHIFEPDLVPLGTISKDINVEEQLLKHYSEGRCIPNGRPLNDKLFTALGMSKSEAFWKSLGLSLTDKYYFKGPEDFDLKWEDINFHDNGFESVLGNLIIKGDTEFSKSPDFTTDGMMDKFWFTTDNKPFLAKIDNTYNNILLANEVVYFDIASSMGINCIPYTQVKAKDLDLVVCPCFINNSSEQFISAMQVKHANLDKAGENLNKYFINELGFKTEMENMMFLDVILHNTDRHERNYGYIEDEKGNRRFAPIFDSGFCLGVNRRPEIQIAANDFRTLYGTRCDILQRYNLIKDIDVNWALASIKHNYESYNIPEQRYEIAKEELLEGIKDLQKTKEIIAPSVYVENTLF